MLARHPAFASRPRAHARTVRATASSKETTVRQTIAANQGGVLVWSKTSCPYCDGVKRLFAKYNVPASRVKYVELDRMGREGIELQDALQAVTGRGTVPQVFIGGNFIGGCDDTLVLHGAGKLKTVLAEAGIDV